MSIPTSRRVIVKAKTPVGEPTPEDFQTVDRAIEPLKDGEILVKALYLSVDPYMRGKLRDMASYTEQYKLNEPIYGFGAGTVIESKQEGFKPGDLVTSGAFQWSEYSVLNGKQAWPLPPNVDLEAALSVTGLTGITAYVGTVTIGAIKSSDTVLVSGAAGATGSVVGQIAKIKGCTVIGIAGSKEKVEFLKSIGFDAAINYKDTTDLQAELKQTLASLNKPGIDLFFDNVGGTTLDAAVPLLNTFARIVGCGAISLYNATKQEVGPRLDASVIIKRLRYQGFIVSDYLGKPEWKEAQEALGGWLAEKKIKNQVTVSNGLDSIVQAFIGLFRGSNVGKMLVKLA